MVEGTIKLMWMLVHITIEGTMLKGEGILSTPSMADCFNMRDKLVEEIGRPIINYQAICVPHIMKTEEVTTEDLRESL